jgi:hypothetical protein
MNTPDFARSLRAFTQRRPFRPFLLELVSGDRFLVRHPEAVILRGDLVYWRTPQRLARLFDTTTVCQLLDVPPSTPT